MKRLRDAVSADGTPTVRIPDSLPEAGELAQRLADMAGTNVALPAAPVFAPVTRKARRGSEAAARAKRTAHLAARGPRLTFTPERGR